MADFIISPYAISYNSIKNALQSYIQNKSDVTTKWKDFYTAGAGETILELDAAVASFYAFHFIIGRRESFLTVAQNYNSIVGGALSLGYNCSRGHNVHVRIQIIPNTTQTLSKWTVVGSYAEYDVVLLKDTILNEGEPTTIDCVIGNSAVQGVRISSTALQQFVFTASNTTDDCRLILTDREVPFTTEIKDAVNDYYIMLTNSFGSVDVFYLNKGNYNYTPADTLYLNYIERNNLQFGSISGSNIHIDIASQVDDIILLEDRLDVEDKEHIRLSAPLYHETNNVVRARKDYVKFLKQHNTLIIDANDKDINPGLIALTYLKNYDSEAGTSLLTEEEKQEYVRFMQTICPDGVAKAFIEDPVRVVRSLAISLWQQSGENITANIDEDIEAILDKYRNKLAPVLDLEQIEHDIEDLPGVKIARVDIGAQEYQSNTKYKLYDVVTVPNIKVGTDLQTWTFYCGKVQAQTGETEPDWAFAGSEGQQVQDNNFIWENSNKYANAINAVWKQNGEYSLYSDINMSYEVPPKCTLQTQPIWGDTTQKDGNITWNKLFQYDSKIEPRQDNKVYVQGEQVFVNHEDETAVYTVNEITHKSGSSKPNWSQSEIGETLQDNALTWQYAYAPWKPNYKYIEEQEIAVDVDNTIYVYRCVLAGETGSENVLIHPDNIGKEVVEEYKTVEKTIEKTTTNSEGEQVVTKEFQETQELLIRWVLVNSFENVSTWKADTEFDNDTYIIANYKTNIIIDGEKTEIDNTKYFKCTSISNTTSGTANFYEDKWLESVTDNNVKWILDTYTIDDVEYKCIGKQWKPSTEYEVGDNLICNSASTTYIYEAQYVGQGTIEETNVIYSVVNYAGTTSSVEPTWDQDNVVDNDILWTKTENQSAITWQANTSKRHGDIITTPNGYYVFSSVLGTSGVIDPDWAGIENKQVKDNNITWIRLTDSTTMALQWNEYLELKANRKIVG